MKARLFFLRVLIGFFASIIMLAAVNILTFLCYVRGELVDIGCLRGDIIVEYKFSIDGWRHLCFHVEKADKSFGGIVCYLKDSRGVIVIEKEIEKSSVVKRIPAGEYYLGIRLKHPNYRLKEGKIFLEFPKIIDPVFSDSGICIWTYKIFPLNNRTAAD